MARAAAKAARPAIGSRHATARLVRLLGVSRRVPAAPLLALGAMAALTVWVFHEQLFDGWSFPWDFLGGYSATPAFVAATFGRGHPLAFSPFVAGGFPVDVDPQAGVYFPLWWLLGALRVPLTLGVLTSVQVFHVLFGAAGAMLLARARRLAWSWAALTGVAYLFFGGFYGQAEHADVFRGFAYLPWLLWALTPPAGSGRWLRLVALPPLAWLIATGAYPTQLVSFAIAGLVYVAVALRVQARERCGRDLPALALAVLASAAVCLAVLLPYLRAQGAGELVRTNQPTAAFRAMFAISPLDLLGLYLNNFAWTSEGTITTWAVGIPILVGLACARRATFARQAPLLACGAVALALGMAPKVGLLGRAMASGGFLFTSRFPASDYKAIVALAMIVLAADAWSRLAGRPGRSRASTAVLAGCALAAGALLAPSTHAQPTRKLWLVLVVIAVAAGLVLARPPAKILVGALLALVVVDGLREIGDYRLNGTTSPWHAAPATLAYYRERDGYVRELPELLAEEPARRPERVPQSPVPEANASGWVAEGYFASDYSSFRERALLQAEARPAFMQLLLAPWQAFTFPCATVGCGTGAVRLPAVSSWRESSGVRTLAYGPDRIVYAVDVNRPELMVENELAIAGWRSSSPRVRSVQSGTPLRAWRLSPGEYEFTASFAEPGRTLQESLAALAVLAWLACAAAVAAASRSRRGRGERPGRPGRGSPGSP
jgi:hypothetical protein